MHTHAELYLSLAAAALHPVPAFELPPAAAGPDPLLGLLLMALGLLVYSACLCLRDRWWQWEDIG